MRAWLRRALLRWRSRGWRAEDHGDCIMWLGPCGRCRDRLRARGIDPDGVRPIMELMAAATGPEGGDR